MISSIKLFRWLPVGIGIVLLISGCLPTIHIARTVGLPGLPPLAGGDQVTLVKSHESVTQPYQVVGQVTMYREGAVLYEGSSFQKMKDVAAGMGADGLIGLEAGMNYHNANYDFVRSGLAVKWLAPGEAKRPLTLPFLVAVIPVVEDPDAPGNQAKITQALHQGIIPTLAMKGYYVLPESTVKYKGGIEDVKGLPDAELKALAGEDTNLLMEVAVTARAKVNIVIASGAGVSVMTSLMDLKTRNMVYSGSGYGTVSAGWLVNMLAPNEKWTMAATSGTQVSLKGLKPIHEKLGD